MGLSGRKQKQRIGPDPRNLSWADDASKFGTSYLSKFGWDASQGLGASGDGRTSHIKVQQKLDMMGIGAQHQKDPNGIAWKQNKDFENVLRRLNASMGGGDPDALEDEEKTALAGAFISATEETTVGKVDKKEKKDKKKDKKRKRSDDDSDEEDTKKKAKIDDTSVVPVSETVVTVQKEKVVPRHRAHRARAIAAKNRAGNSSAALSEILGISSQSTTPTPGTSTPITKLDEPPTMEKLTVSTKSVADYFKERLLAKANGKTPIPSTTPSRTDDDEVPSGGIGSSRSELRLSSRFSDDEDAPRPMGLGMSKFGSLMSSAFLAATTSVGLTAPKSDPESVEEDSEEVKGKKEKKKRKRKDSEVEDAELLAKKRRKEEKKAKKEREREREAQKVEEPKLSKEERKKLKSERQAEKKKRREQS